MKKYLVNEIFGPTLQGEGARAGTPNIWVRFAECNLTCSADGEAGFDCDTNFSGGERMDADELLARTIALAGPVQSVVFSGGEPALQLDEELIDAFQSAGFMVAVETNGTRPLPSIIDWLSVSPKTAEHTLRVLSGKDAKVMVDELRYVRAIGQAIPAPCLQARYYYISPAFESDGSLKRETLDHCVGLVLANPKWRLSVQAHKLWRIR